MTFDSISAAEMASNISAPRSPEESFLAVVDSVMESDWLANLANFSSLVMTEFQDLNWVGFYLLKPLPVGAKPLTEAQGATADEVRLQRELVLGPFQGRPACIRIRLGKGVCGTAARENRVMIVEDVDQFPGHIVCDSASKSELVVPMLIHGEVRAVLDVDAPIIARFDKKTAETLEKAVKILLSKSIWPAAFL